MTWKPISAPTVRQQRGKWVVRVDGIDTATGSKRPHQLGTYSSQRAARAAASGFTVERVTTLDKGTVASVLDRWLSTKTDVSAKSLAQYEWAAGHVRQGLGAIPLEHLERTDVAAWLEGLASGGTLSRRGIQMCRTVLRAALDDAVEDGLLHRSPATKVPMPKYVAKQGLQREQPFWSESDVTRFMAVADLHRWGAGFRLCVLYGLRRSELLALRWDDIDPVQLSVRVDEGLIEVKGKMAWSNAKSERSRRTIPIDVATMKRLLQHQAEQAEARLLADAWDDSTLVFTTRTGAPIQPRHFDRVLERLVVKAGVPRLTSHGLRHTAATHMMQGTKDYSEFRAIADIAGHSPEMLLKVYAHTLPTAMRAVASRVGERSAELDGGSD